MTSSVPNTVIKDQPRPSFSDEIATANPPDGGLKAWLQVLAAHLMVFNTFGYINSFGIFQPYYTATLNTSPSDISWIGSIEIFLVYFGGVFSGRALDAGFFHPTIVTGLLLQLVGVFAASVSKQYWQLFLAQGLCQGLGNGLLFCPVVAVVSTYFTKKRALAISIQAAGGATGGMVFPAIAQSLLSRIGFGQTVRVMGYVMLFNAMVALALLRTRVAPRKNDPMIDWSAIRELPYVLFTAGAFFTFWGVFFSFYYVRPFARDILSVSPYTSFSFLLVLNGIGVPGRIIPGLISDQFFGPIDTFIPVVLLAGLSLFCWIAINMVNDLWAFVAVFGFFGAGIQSLLPAALATLTADVSRIGVRIGMAFSVISVACLSGPPLAGRLIEAHGGEYLGAQIFGGVSMICGCLLLVATRVAKDGFMLKKKE